VVPCSWQRPGPIPLANDKQAAADLAGAVRTAATPPEDPTVREALAGFLTPIGTMLLACQAWAEALAGRLPGEAAAVEMPPASGPIQPHRHIPPASETGTAEIYGRIRAGLRTPLINSIWRSLAARGLLEPAWSALEPQIDVTRQTAHTLGEQARHAARELSWPVVADSTALENAGIADAAPGMAAILDAYTTTLPRVLTLVACCG
jgi:hypothetical protein